MRTPRSGPSDSQQEHTPSPLVLSQRRPVTGVEGEPARVGELVAVSCTPSEQKYRQACGVSFLKGRGGQVSETRVCGRLSGFPGRCRQAPSRGRGQDSPGGRPGGLGLDVGSGWRRLCAPETRDVCGPCFSIVRYGLSAQPGARSPCIPSPPAAGWHGVLRPQPAGVNQILDRAHCRGVTPHATSRAGCAGFVLTRAGAGYGGARRAARSRPA